jgi:hypothetical protein
MKETDYVYPVHSENRAGYLHFGLEARDYIAIQAMTGLLAGISASHGTVPMPSYESIAKDSYKMADEMLKQSEV